MENGSTLNGASVKTPFIYEVDFQKQNAAKCIFLKINHKLSKRAYFIIESSESNTHSVAWIYTTI